MLFSENNIDDFVKSPISALRAIFEEYHVHLSALNSSKIAQALILAFLQSRLTATFYETINIPIRFEWSHRIVAPKKCRKTVLVFV